MRHPTVGCKPTGEGLFGTWLCNRILWNNRTVEECAEMLHITRACVSQHLHKRSKPTFPMVVGYCWIFNMEDDPKHIWKFVEEDWG